MATDSKTFAPLADGGIRIGIPPDGITVDLTPADVDELRRHLSRTAYQPDKLGVTGSRSKVYHRAKARAEKYARRGIDLTPDRLARKLRISAGYLGSTLWSKPPPEWRLVGPWPPELADLGIGPEARP